MHVDAAGVVAQVSQQCIAKTWFVRESNLVELHTVLQTQSAWLQVNVHTKYG